MTELELLNRHFMRMGARLKIAADADEARGRVGPWRWSPRPRSLSLDVQQDRRGEYFELRLPVEERVELQVLDVQPTQRHLVLMARGAEGKEKFLCGHDERHWFVAAVPGQSVSTVTTAMDALKPAPVRAAESRRELPNKARFRRRNAAFVRQGEWFFVPATEVVIPANQVLKHEPLQRGRGKPHMVDELARLGGGTVYVSRFHAEALGEREYREFLKRRPWARGWDWRAMRRDAEVYVRGHVRHADHKTILLDGWHRVLMNTETETPAMRHVAFLD